MQPRRLLVTDAAAQALRQAPVPLILNVRQNLTIQPH